MKLHRRGHLIWSVVWLDFCTKDWVEIENGAERDRTGRKPESLRKMQQTFHCSWKAFYQRTAKSHRSARKGWCDDLWFHGKRPVLLLDVIAIRLIAMSRQEQNFHSQTQGHSTRQLLCTDRLPFPSGKNRQNRNHNVHRTAFVTAKQSPQVCHWPQN